MIRLCLVIFLNLYCLPRIIYTMRKMADEPEKYSLEEGYKYVQYVVGLMQRAGRIRTKVYGEENLPREGGYMMCPNHQGKYDMYGIVSVHNQPCTVIMDDAKSHDIFVREAIDLIRGKRLIKGDMRQNLRLINQVAEEVKQGARYVVFPEGKYVVGNENKVSEFQTGCFKIAFKAKAPVIPVVLIDSFKVFNTNHIGKVTTQVHYLEPIYYDEYKEMKVKELAEVVKQNIVKKIDEIINV